MKRSKKLDPKILFLSNLILILLSSFVSEIWLAGSRIQLRLFRQSGISIRFFNITSFLPQVLLLLSTKTFHTHDEKVHLTMRVPLWELMQRSSPTNNSWLQTFRKVRSYFLWCKRVALAVCVLLHWRCCFCDGTVWWMTLHGDPVSWLWDEYVRWPCSMTLSVRWPYLMAMCDHPVWRPVWWMTLSLFCKLCICPCLCLCPISLFV